MNSDSRLDRVIILPTTAILVAVAVVHFFWAPPIVSHDTAFGILTWQSMESGAGWNELYTPRADDISGSQGSFLTWWSPGQYLPAGLLMHIGFSLGAAIVLTTLIGSWSLLIGLWRLCLALGEPPHSAAISAGVVALTWHTLYAFGFFIGGEVALAAVWPWILLVAWRTRGQRWLQLTLLPLLFVAGSYAKLSFQLYALGILAFLWLQECDTHRWKRLALLDATVRSALVLVFYLTIWHYVFMSRGPTPANSLTHSVPFGVAWGFALNAPWFSAVGFGSLLGRLFMVKAVSALEGFSQLRPVLLPLAFVALAAYGLLVRSRIHLFRLAGTISLTSAILLATLLWWGASVSLEDRHLRPAGILLLAVCASIAVGRVSVSQRLAVSALVLSALFGIAATGQRISNIKKLGVRSVRDISMLDIDEPALRFLEANDEKGLLICLPRAMLIPALQRARILLFDEAEKSVLHQWRGRVPSLMLVFPAEDVISGRAAALRASFLDYHELEWRVVKRGSWEFWQAGTAASANMP